MISGSTKIFLSTAAHALRNSFPAVCYLSLDRSARMGSRPGCTDLAFSLSCCRAAVRCVRKAECKGGYCWKKCVLDSVDVICWFLKPRIRTDNALKHMLAEFRTSQ